MQKIFTFAQSSIGKKQTVAVTGLLLIGFVIGHLAGNLFVYGGPELFNAYAKKLASFRPFLNIIEGILLIIFVTHIYITAQLVMENLRARANRYAVYKPEPRSFVARLMPLSGTIVFAFVIWHLLDFTFTDHHGSRSILADGQSYGLYGVVYNSFSDPAHSILYIIAMIAVGLHLSHGIQSFCQTYGLNHPQYTPMITRFSNWFAVIITVGYSSIPIYVYLNNKF